MDNEEILSVDNYITRLKNLAIKLEENTTKSCEMTCKGKAAEELYGIYSMYNTMLSDLADLVKQTASTVELTKKRYIEADDNAKTLINDIDSHMR